MSYVSCIYNIIKSVWTNLFGIVIPGINISFGTVLIVYFVICIVIDIFKAYVIESNRQTVSETLRDSKASIRDKVRNREN